MARISRPTLELLSHDHATRIATLKISYTVRLTAFEASLTGLQYKEDIELWGADAFNSDDYLLRLATEYFPLEDDGIVERERTVTVPAGILDEDEWIAPTDEIYAKIWIAPVMPTGATAETNEISHEFGD